MSLGLTSSGRSIRSVSAILIILALAGCDNNFFKDPIAIQRDGDHLLIAVCTDVDAESIHAEVRHLSESNSWSVFIDSTTQMSMPSGSIISTADFSAAEAHPPSFQPNTQIFVSIDSVEDGGSQAADFTLGEDLSETHWLQPSGDETVEPCIDTKARRK